MRCAVYGCNSDTKVKTPKIKFHRFPKDSILGKLWENACCRTDTINVASARICSQHFKNEDFERNFQFELLGYLPKAGFKLKLGAVPSLNLPEIKSLTKQQVDYNERASKKFGKIDAQDNIVLALNISDNLQESSHQNTAGLVSPSIPRVTSDVLPTYRSVGVTTLAIDGKCYNDSMGNNAQVIKKCAECEKNNKAMKRIFTERQIKVLANPHVRPIWSAKEISEAEAIHSAGPNAYRLLLEKGYPFPAISTLKVWRRKNKIASGIKS
uniref:THAP-type domain-containing protein n=1 Tax=Dendroctonus ponderosae TaxID=77166 RepID=A0AAR5Q2R2_DENPD